MIRLLALSLFLSFLFTVPVQAQEDADAVLAEQEAKKETIKPIEDDGNYEVRLELSEKMHEIWPIRPRIESALDDIAEQIPPGDQLKFKAAMRKAIEFQALEQASIDAMADIFSEKELEAMIAFYGSKEGRSVSHKTGDYEKALQPVMIKMIDKALADVKLGSQ